MNNDLTYNSLQREERVNERERARRNIEWFNRTIEGWQQVMSFEERGVMRIKYIKSKKYGKGK